MTDYEKKQIIVGWLEDYDAMKMSIKNLNEMVKDLSEANMGVDTRREKTSHIPLPLKAERESPACNEV